MLLSSSIVFTNLFLIPLLFHPFIVCRYFIHIGHEPFPAKPLKKTSYEYDLYHFFEHSTTYLHRYLALKHENIFERMWNLFFKSSNKVSQKYFYPNLIKYTEMYLYDHDLSPFTQSFLSMYISYFLLTYFSSLVHVYRISFKNKQNTFEQIHNRAKQLIESSYVRWIFHALFWKFLGVLISHLFHVMAVKILMQSLFQSYEHFHLHDHSIYSSWNFQKNLLLIYKYEGWKVLLGGIISRMIYELGITLLPRLIWWPFRSYFIGTTLKSYFHASSIELYFIQCLCENLFRCFFVYLQIFARLSTIEIVNQMHEQIHRKNYPLLYLLSHQPWSLPFPMHLIDARLMTKDLSIFFRQVN